LRISVRVYHTLNDRDDAASNMASSDEYTALQKYISTYRDPRAADAAENQVKDTDEKKPKAAWQVSSGLRSFTPTRQSLTLLLVLEVWQR